MTRKFNGQSIVIASHNSGKIFEFEELFSNSGYHITSASQLGFPEPVEDGLSFKENAEIKARASALLAGYPSISDDSGLVVPLINDEPGIHSARWALTKSGDKDFNLAIEKIENKIVTLGERPSGQNAYFVCALTMCWPDGHMETVEGYVHGKLTFPSKGNKGFGYDPIFIPNGQSLTYGEIEPEEKHQNSHRADAFKQLLTACFSKNWWQH